MLSPEIVARERQKFIDTMEETRNLAVLALRTEMKKMVDKFVERLTPNADGSRKVFHKTTVTENFEDFFNTFKTRNIFDDKELASIIKKAKEVISGVDVETLRNDDELKDEIVKDMSKIAEELDKAIVDAPSRKLRM